MNDRIAFAFIVPSNGKDRRIDSRIILGGYRRPVPGRYIRAMHRYICGAASVDSGKCTSCSIE